MKIIIVVQARMKSTRLLGKTMLQVKGRPLLGYLLDRLECVRNVDQIVVAIPKCDYDTSLARYVKERNVMLFCGCEENDLVARFMGVIAATGCDGFIRVCADSPLLDPEQVQAAVDVLRDPDGADFWSNVGWKCIAPGNSVEACTVEVYKYITKLCSHEDREHAGFPWFYREQARKSLLVDTPEDFERVRKAIESMDRPHTDYGWTEASSLIP
jgi:spore coat polysaccharide biosynthesis protein SpsF (cytidylyltransferase family)